MTTYGVLGVGNVGGALARRIIRGGDEVMLWNRTTLVAEELAGTIGGMVAPTPRALIETCSIVWGCLTGWDAVSACYLAEGGLLDGDGSDGRVVIELGTLQPDQVNQLDEAVTAAGHTFVYAALSGRPIDLEEGRGFIMASGTAVSVAEPLLSTLGSFHHVGDSPGDAATMKLALTVMIFGNLCTTAEALTLATRGGISRERAYDLFAKSLVGSPLVQQRRDYFVNPEGQPVQGTFDLASKNYGLILQLASTLGAQLPQAERSAELLQQALAAGYGELDLTRLPDYLSELSSTDCPT